MTELGSEPVRIETPELVLRAYEGADAPDLLLAFADPDMARWSPGPLEPADVLGLIAKRNDWSGGGHASWAVGDPSGRLIGGVSLHAIDRKQANAEIGYWIAPWARGRGQATRAVTLVTQFAFAETDLHRLYLLHAVVNPASCSVARAAGYVYEGTLRRAYRYGDGVFHDEHLHARLRGDT